MKPDRRIPLVSHFQLNGQIGSGGMATVYAADWLLPGQEGMPVACKIVRADRMGSRHLRLFWREAAINLRISNNHPRLVSVYECFLLEGSEPCMVMELVEGCSLAEMGHPFPPAIVRRVAADVLDGLHYMHSLDVLHRDIKPDNILVSRAGEIKISDLGLAKPIPDGRGQASNGFCTYAYASPEVLQQGTVDPRSDLYSLGAVLYGLFAGYPPCGEETSFDRLLTRVLEGAIKPLPDTVPRDLRELITALLDVNPDMRPSSARDALDMLDQGDGAMAAPDALGRMVTPIYEKKCEERDRSRYRDLRARETIEAPILMIGSAKDGGEARITNLDIDPDPRVHDDHPVERRRRLVPWLILAVLNLAVVGYLTWRSFAQPSTVEHAPVTAPVSGEEKNIEVPERPGALEQGQSATESTETAETPLSSPAIDAHFRDARAGQSRSRVRQTSDHSKANGTSKSTNKGSWKNAPVGGKPPAELGLSPEMMKEGQP
jgi:serine/threonine protein kinase